MEVSETTKEDFSEQKTFSDLDILSNTVRFCMYTCSSNLFYFNMQPKSRRYINHGGNFITGIDVTSQVSHPYVRVMSHISPNPLGSC